ncbi:MAG: DNA-directed RNA polymerase subunit omega [Planctomycetota bacterium]
MDYFVRSRSVMDIETEEALVSKVGGKFALTALLQKRIVELNRGAPPLVPLQPGERDWKKIACREILEGKLVLGALEEPEYAGGGEARRIAGSKGSEGGEGGAEIYGSDVKKIKEQRIKELAQLLNPKTK